MNTEPIDPHTPLVEALAMLEGLSGLAAYVSDNTCPISGFSLMMLLEPLIERVQRAKELLESARHPLRER